MAIGTYDELKSSIASWLHRQDLTASIPDFITLCESYINSKLRLRSMIQSVTLNPSTTATTLALPTGFLEPISFTDDLGDTLQQVHPDELAELAYSANAYRPEYYAITDKIEFPRKADATYDFKLTYYKALDIATDGTNDVLTDYPNIYLYGSLVQAEPYLKNDNRLQLWASLYEEAVKLANNRNQQNLRKLRTDHPAVNQGFNILRGY